MNRRFLIAIAALAACLPGCVATDSIFSKSHYGPEKEKPPTGIVQRVEPMWENRVITTQDTMNEGRPLLGLAGRVYFFGSDIGYPLMAKGTTTVDAHEIMPDGTTRMMERWEIDSTTLQKLGHKDRIGWGYTVFLPWSTYRPDLARVQLQVKFVPEQGVPLFSAPASVSLRQDSPPVITTTSTNIVPTAAERR